VVFQPGCFHQLFKQAFSEEKDLTFLVIVTIFPAAKPQVMCSPFHTLGRRVDFAPIPVSCEPLIALQDGTRS
jgi:hypothetical protein